MFLKLIDYAYFHFIKGQDFITANAHESFAPVRKNQRAYWFVDGDSLMSAVADVIEQVSRNKREISLLGYLLTEFIFKI